MKKILLCLVLVAGALGSALAQEHRHEVNLTIGFMPREYTVIETGPEYSGDLASLYEPHVRAEGAPLIGADYAYAVLPWLKLGGTLDYTYLLGETYEAFRNKATGKYERYIVYLMPQAKVFALDIPHFKMYAKVATGLELNLGNADVPVVNFAWSVTPLGMQWAGDRVYGTLELTNGNVLRGIRLGVGLRF